MKRLSVFVLGLLVFVSCFAADSSWDFMKGVKAIDVEIDFHKAIINNFSEEEFVTYYSQFIQQENWYPTSQNYWKKAFLEEFADQTLEKHCLAGEAPTAKIKMLITLLSATDSGDLQTSIAFIDKETNTTLKTVEMASKGGHFGGIINLISDGFENLGESIGKQVRKHL